MFDLFTYGSLMFPEVMEAVTGRTFERFEATLDDYERLAIIGKPYPGIRFRRHASVRGVLHRGIDGKSLTALDRFEDKLYERREVVVSTDWGSINALAYVVREMHSACLSNSPWDAEAFLSRDFANYLARCRAFAAGA